MQTVVKQLPLRLFIIPIIITIRLGVIRNPNPDTDPNLNRLTV